MPKLDLSRAVRIKGASGEITRLKGAGFSWDKPSNIALGLSAPLLELQGVSAAWVQRTVDLSAYAGADIRLVWRTVLGMNSNSWTNDVQIDEIAIDGNTFTFEGGVEGFEKTTQNNSPYESQTWNPVTSVNNAGTFCRGSGGTPSGGTGVSGGANGSSYYLYLESSFPVRHGDLFWVRSPVITLGQSPGNLTFYEARAINDPDTTLDFFVDVISV